MTFFERPIAVLHPAMPPLPASAPVSASCGNSWPGSLATTRTSRGSSTHRLASASPVLSFRRCHSASVFLLLASFLDLTQGLPQKTDLHLLPSPPNVPVLRSVASARHP